MEQDRQEKERTAAAVWKQEELERLSSQELLALYRDTGSEEAKWALVLRMTDLVRSIASQVCGLYSSFAQLDDIVEEGILVLLSAVDKYDPAQNTKFETYVAKRLRGMIVDLARKQDWVPRQLRQKAARLSRQTEDLANRLGRMPSSQEMADDLGISRAEYDALLSETAVSNLLSLEAVLDSSGGQGVRGQDMGSSPEEVYEERELYEVLRQSVAGLRDKERLVLSLFYEKGMSMKEIAQVLHVSPPRVSQIHSKAISHLRLAMKQYIEA